MYRHGLQRGYSGCDEHVSLALRAAQEGIVLMQNENNVLPLDRNSINKIALFGKFGDKENIGDYGSSRVYPKYVVTPMQRLYAMSHLILRLYITMDLILSMQKTGKKPMRWSL